MEGGLEELSEVQVADESGGTVWEKNIKNFKTYKDCGLYIVNDGESMGVFRVSG